LSSIVTLVADLQNITSCVVNAYFMDIELLFRYGSRTLVVGSACEVQNSCMMCVQHQPVH